METKERRLAAPVDLVLLTGYARSGKSTAASHLVANHGFKELSFAAPLYNGLCAIFDVDRAFIEKHKAEQIHVGDTQLTWRQALQTLGTEWGRKYLGANIWATIVRDRIIAEALIAEYAFEPRPRFVISDCRFINEWQQFVDHPDFNMRMIYLFRKEAEPQTHHASEQEIDQLGIVHSDIILANMTIDMVQQRLDDYVRWAFPV